MKKKVLSIVLASVMVASLLSGCGGNSSSTKDNKASTESKETGSTGGLDTTEEVNLVMYVIGDRPAGQDVNDENFNNIIKDKLNCTLTVNWIPWSDYSNKYPLLFSSGEQFDIAYSATWLNFTSLAQKGAFMSLDELWPTYAPKNFAATAETAKKQATIDGHYYGVPTLLATYGAYGPIYRTDIMEGSDWDGKMETFEDIEKYCDIVKETHPELEPVDIYSAGSELDDTYMWSLGYQSSKGTTNDFLFFDPTQENPKLFTYYETAEIPTFLEMMNRWNEKGFFTKSALSDTDSTKIQNGKAALRIHNLDNLANYATIHPEYNLQYANMRKYMTHLPYTQDTMVISNTSQNPERAMALWDLITNDQDVFDAFYYGVLGTTYDLNDEGQYSITDSNLYAVSDMWASRSSELNRNIAGTPESYDEWKQKFEASIAADDTAEKYSSFSLDTSSIETEYAACLSVHQQYWWPLELGYTDATEGLKEYQEKMEAAGIEKVRAEIQKQLDEYVANLQ
ncbi:MAG: ABC transporter substrate-binding protein [Velocimicrobium sp.]